MKLLGVYSSAQKPTSKYTRWTGYHGETGLVVESLEKTFMVRF